MTVVPFRASPAIADVEETREVLRACAEMDLWQSIANLPWAPSALRQPVPPPSLPWWGYVLIVLMATVYVGLPALGLWRMIAG
jgi:hypothetical protein